MEASEDVSGYPEAYSHLPGFSFLFFLILCQTFGELGLLFSNVLTLSWINF